MKPNPYQTPVSIATELEVRTKSRFQFIPMLVTAAFGVGIMLASWVLIVSTLDRANGSDLLWAGSLWVSMILATSIVVLSRRSVRPGPSCAFGFAIFAVMYMLLEGSVTGSSTHAMFVGLTLFGLPFGAMLVAMFWQYAWPTDPKSDG